MWDVANFRLPFSDISRESPTLADTRSLSSEGPTCGAGDFLRISSFYFLTCWSFSSASNSLTCQTPFGTVWRPLTVSSSPRSSDTKRGRNFSSGSSRRRTSPPVYSGTSRRSRISTSYVSTSSSTTSSDSSSSGSHSCQPLISLRNTGIVGWCSTTRRSSYLCSHSCSSTPSSYSSTPTSYRRRSRSETSYSSAFIMSSVRPHSGSDPSIFATSSPHESYGRSVSARSSSTTSMSRSSGRGCGSSVLSTRRSTSGSSSSWSSDTSSIDSVSSVCRRTRSSTSGPTSGSDLSFSSTTSTGNFPRFTKSCLSVSRRSNSFSTSIVYFCPSYATSPNSFSVTDTCR